MFLANFDKEKILLLKTFTTKDVKLVFGPTTSLNNIVRKRIKRRQIQLVKKTDR